MAVASPESRPRSAPTVIRSPGPRTANCPWWIGWATGPRYPLPDSTYTSALKSRRQGMLSRAPFSTVACASVIGVCVTPGPGWPSISPAMNADQRPAVVGRQQRGVTTLDGLVPRRRELVLFRQVHPELDAVEQAAAVDEFGRRRLDVQDARAGGHPLGRSVGDQAAAAVGVLVREFPVEHVGHRFEAAVRVPVGAPGFAGLIVHLAHLVHVDEGVQGGATDPGEGPHDGEPLALVPARAGGDRSHRPLGVGGSGAADARQCQWVGRNCGQLTSS